MILSPCMRGAVLMLLFALPLAAQFEERIDVIAVEVPITVHDRDGKVPLDLTRDDFEVFEDGVRQEVIGLTYPVAPVPVGETPAGQRAETPAVRPAQRWQIVILLNESMSTTPGLRQAARALLEQSERLTAMGDVEIVTDYPTPHVILPPATDANVLRAKLEELHRTALGREEVVRMREMYEREKRFNRDLEERSLTDYAVVAAEREAATVRRRQAAMLAWMARYASENRAAPRLLLYVSDGHPLDPSTYYVNAVEQIDAARRQDLLHLNGEARQSELARTMAAMGWTVLAVAPRAAAATRSMTDKTYDDIVGPQPVNLAMPLDTLASVNILRDETGGRIATDMRRVGGEIEALQQRLTLTYRARRPRDGKLHALDIRSRRPGLVVDSRRAVSTSTAEGVTKSRAVALALSFGDRGELAVTCGLRRGSTLDDEAADVDVDFAPLGAARATMKAASLRVAVAVTPDRKLPYQDLQRFENVDLSASARWGAQIPLRRRGSAPAAVVVEEIATGAWGGARCEAAGLDVVTLPDRWHPLAEAIAVARANQRLVLLYVRGNKRTDEWITKSMDYAPLAHLYDQLELAYAPSLPSIRGPRLVLLDDSGNTIVPLPHGFGDYAAFTPTLGELVRQSKTLLLAAESRREGKNAEALVREGYALYDAGIRDGASDAFERAAAEAEKEGNREAAQLAELGTIRLKMRTPKVLVPLIAQATQVAERAVSPAVAASAWILIAQARQGLNDRAGAAKAYQRAYESAPKPSQMAEAALRGYEAASGAMLARVEPLSVAIKPFPSDVEERALVEIDAKAPRGASVTAVDVFWNEERVATLTAAPYRHELVLPEKHARGYVRVVARDSTGGTAEDVRVVNAPSETVQVDAVELYAITRERGLTAADFLVREDGREVEVELRGTPDDPITVGIVVDASASMRRTISDVVDRASTFIRNALRPGDQVFVVAFDEAPQLVQPLTSDRDAARVAVMDVGATGNTALWDSLAFSLERFRTVPGKRALLLFTDGEDTGSRLTMPRAIAIAREVGVPVYVVAFAPDVPSRAREWRLEEIAESTGGVFFKQPRADEYTRIFEQVRDDTRSEYILAYVSPSTKPRGELRRVSVTLRRGGTVRATSGYYPR